MKNILIRFVLLVQVFSAISSAQVGKNRNIPDVQLAVAAREQENGKIGKSIYLFTLKCQHGECELTTIRFRCEKYSWTTRDSSFRPEVWRSSTAQGTLTVNNLGNQLEVLETSTDFDGSTRGNFFYGYSQSSTTNFAGKVTSFSGGWIMTIQPLKEIHTIEFVPFIGSDALVQLDCNTLWLPGVDTTK